jgi:2-keto-3-deoxy-L-rhamnonate aldolase RhmA
MSRILIPDLSQKETPALGVALTFLCPELIEFFGLLGFAWVFLDAEHTPVNPHVCRELVRAADLAKMSCVVRVPEIKPAVIESYLDIGVSGIVAPNVASPEQVEALISAVKFSPMGERGAASRSRAAGYGLTRSPAEFYRQANQHTWTVVLIESQQGIDNLKEIISVPGLDYIALGAHDLGLSLGTERGIADPAVRALVEQAQTQIQGQGKSRMEIVSDAEQGRKAAQGGAKLIAVPDSALLTTAARTFIKAASLSTPDGAKSALNT